MSHSFDSLPDDDVLTTSLFHKVLVAFNVPTAWPSAVIGLIILLLSGLLASVWGSLSGNWLLAGLIDGGQLAFHAADVYLLNQLPRRRISFGPWQGQFFALAVPRLTATLVLGLAGIWLGWWVAAALFLLIQLLGSVALYRGAIVEPQQLELTHLDLVGNPAPASTTPVRILHISDLHIERLGGREERVLQLVDETRPDVIVITGDYVNLSYNLDPVTHAQVQQLLSQLHAPCGVYAVPGSPPVDLHDTIPPLFDDLPVRMLRNEIVKLELGQNRCLSLIGMDCHHNIERDSAVLAELQAGVSKCGPQVLLYHSPELMPQATTHGIHLYVCGHTHGGQVRLPFIGPLLTSSRLGRRYVMGHYHEKQTHLYISRGVGFEGLSAPRVRLFCPPEMTLITVLPGNKSA